jgi:hypothetical protein
MYNRTFLIKVKNKKVMPNLLDTTFFIKNPIVSMRHLRFIMKLHHTPYPYTQGYDPDY